MGCLGVTDTEPGVLGSDRHLFRALRLHLELVYVTAPYSYTCACLYLDIHRYLSICRTHLGRDIQAQK